MRKTSGRAWLGMAAMAAAALVVGNNVGCGGSDDDSGAPGSNANDSGAGTDANLTPPNGGMDATTGMPGDDASTMMMMDGNAPNDGASGTNDGGDAGDAGLTGMFHRLYMDDAVTTALHSGSSWYLGGSFTHISPHLTPNFALLDATGALGTTCSFGSGFTGGTVNALAQSGNAIFAAGSFTAYNGVAAPYLVKIDATTCALDTTFTPTGTTGFGASVGALLVVGTSLYAGGAFTTYRGATVNHVAKLSTTDGTVDLTFSPTAGNGVTGTGASAAVVSSLATDGTSLYVGGQFTQALHGTATTPAVNIAKLTLTTGLADTTFSPATGGNGFDTEVASLVVAGTSLYVGGFFTAYRGVAASANHLAKLSLSSGVLDTTFSAAGANGTNGVVESLVASTTSLYIGGQFTAYRGVAASAGSLAKLDLTSGAIDTTFSPPALNGFTAGNVQSLALSGNTLFAGGGFSGYRGVTGSARSFAKLDATTGAQDTSFAPTDGTANGFGGFSIGGAVVSTILVAGSSIFVGGNFSTYGGYVTNRIAKVDDRTFAVDTTFSPAAANGFNASVSSLAASGTSIYVGGSFSAYRGVAASANFVAKLDAASGALDTTFSPAGATSNGFEAPVDAVAVSGSAVYVGGAFTAYRGVAASANRLAKLDATSGALDTTFSPAGANGFEGAVQALVTSGTSLYVGGAFTAYRGVASSAERLAKLDLTSGALDTTFSPAGSATSNGTGGVVYALAVSNGSLYLGGSFTTYRATTMATGDIAKVDLTSGALDTTFDPSSISPGFTGAVTSLTALGSSVYAGGQFTGYRASANAAFYLAKLDATSGVLDTTFSPPGNGSNGFSSPLAMVSAANGQLLTGGAFMKYRGTNVTQGFAVLDPTSGALP